MKTKFSQLVKVKKQQVDEIESELLETQNQKQKIGLQIQEIIQEIVMTKKPTSGDFSQLNLSYLYLSNLSNQKSSYEQEIERIDSQIDSLKKLHKEANIEYEKIKYLEDIEIKKLLQILKEQEKKEMDEISNLLFLRKNLKFEA